MLHPAAMGKRNTTRSAIMGKEQKSNKMEKKQPAKTAKEKKAAKKIKDEPKPFVHGGH